MRNFCEERYYSKIFEFPNINSEDLGVGGYNRPRLGVY